MDETKIIYHGSNVIVQKPKILINGHYKDFGYGSYCTILKKQAKRWALTKRGESVVNSYAYMKNSKLAKFKYPTHQIVFCTEEALKTVRFEGSEKL